MELSLRAMWRQVWLLLFTAPYMLLAHDNCQTGLQQILQSLSMHQHKLSQLQLPHAPMGINAKLEEFWDMDQNLTNMAREMWEVKEQLKWQQQRLEATPTSTIQEMILELEDKLVMLNQNMLAQSAPLVFKAKDILQDLKIPVTLFHNQSTGQYYLRFELATTTSASPPYALKLFRKVGQLQYDGTEGENKLQLLYHPYSCRVMYNHAFFHRPANALVLGDLEGLWFGPHQPLGQAFHSTFKHEIRHIFGEIKRQKGIADALHLEFSAIAEASLIPNSAYERFLHGEELRNFAFELRDMGKNLNLHTLDLQPLPHQLAQIAEANNELLAISSGMQELLGASLRELDKWEGRDEIYRRLATQIPSNFPDWEASAWSSLENDLADETFTLLLKKASSFTAAAQAKLSMPYVTAEHLEMASAIHALLQPLRHKFNQDITRLMLRLQFRPSELSQAITQRVQEYNSSNELRMVATQIQQLYHHYRYQEGLSQQLQHLFMQAQLLELLAKKIQVQLREIDQYWPLILRGQDALSFQSKSQLRTLLSYLQQHLQGVGVLMMARPE